jgi:protein TonB
MGIVAGLHFAVIFLIARSLGIVPPILQPERVTVVPVDEPAVPDVPLPAVGPKLVDPTLYVPIPVDADVEQPTADNAIAAQPIDPNLSIPDGPGSAIPAIINARQDARHPLSQPRYPSWDTSEGNEGNVDVELYVLPNGRVGDARIVRSSGFERLDQSTIDEAKRNWRLLPATRDGVPFAQWYKVRVTFKLTNK